MFTIEGAIITTQEVIEKIPLTFFEGLTTIFIVGVLLFLGCFMVTSAKNDASSFVFMLGCAILISTLAWSVPNVMGPLLKPQTTDLLNIQYEIVALETPKEEYYYKTKESNIPKVLYQYKKGQEHTYGGDSILGSSIRGEINIQTYNTQFYQLEVLHDGLLSLTNIPVTMVKKKEVANNEENIYKIETVFKEVPMIFSKDEKIDTKIKESIAGADQATQMIVDYYIVEVPKS